MSSLIHLQAEADLSSGFVPISENRSRVPHGTLKIFFSCRESLESLGYVYTRFRNRVALLLSRQLCGNRGIFPNRAKFVGHILAVFQPVALLDISRLSQGCQLLYWRFFIHLFSRPSGIVQRCNHHRPLPISTLLRCATLHCVEGGVFRDTINNGISQIFFCHRSTASRRSNARHRRNRRKLRKLGQFERFASSSSSFLWISGPNCAT